MILFLVGSFTVNISKGDIGKLQLYSPYPGYPEIPVKVLVLELSPDEYVKSVEIKRVLREPFEYNFKYTEPLDTPGGNLHVRHILPKNYPDFVVTVGNQGFLRGRKLAFLIVSALSVENGKTYINRSVEFDVIKGHERSNYVVPAHSDFKVWRDIFSSFGISIPLDSYVPGNRVDYVILTTLNLKPYWKPLADLRNAMGIRTEIFTVEWIRENFPGASDPQRIRNFLKYAYRTWGISYLLIGASPEDVPPLLTYVDHLGDTSSTFFGRYFQNFELTDFYYSALDGDWNPSADEWEGDMEGVWDRNIDLLPDIIVGRYPARTQDEVENYVSSVYEYETRTYFDLPRYLFVASNLFGDTVDPDSADGCLITYDMASHVYVGEKRLLCEKPSSEIRDSINSFSPTFTFFLGHSNQRIIMTRNSRSAYDAFDYNRVLQISSERKFIAAWIGCFINDPFDNSIGLEMVRKGKAVASIGAAKAAYSTEANVFWIPFFDTLSSRGYFPILGDVFFEVKVNIVPLANYSPLFRHLLFTYHIIGDPLLRVFNARRRAINVVASSSSGYVNFQVSDSSTYSPLPLVRVGATDGRMAFGPEYTNSSGSASIAVPPARLIWSAFHPNSLVKVGTLSVTVPNSYLRVDSASLSSPNDTTTLSVWIRNSGSSDITDFEPTLSTYDFYVLSTPPPLNVPARGVTRFDWTVVRSPYLSSPTAYVRVVGPGLDDTFNLSVGVPRLHFISASWYAHYDTAFIFFNVVNSGTDTAYDVRVVPDSTSLSVLNVTSYPSLPPKRSTEYALQVKLLGSSLEGQRIRFRLYAGAILFDTFSVLLRSTPPIPTLLSYRAEPRQGEVMLRWSYIALSDSVRVTWRVVSNGYTLNTTPLEGSYFALRGAPLSKETVVVYPVVDGIEGPPLFSSVIAPQPEMLHSRYLELIRFSSYPVYTVNSQVVMAQLRNYTSQPEIVVATTYNRLLSLTYDARNVLWDVYTQGWIEVPPLVADINGDGVYEVIFATTYYLYALSGYDGSTVLQVPLPTFPSSPDSTPHPRYIMITKPFADSLPFIFMLSQRGSALLFNSSGDLVAYRLNSLSDTNSISPPATYDFDGDGNWEIVYRVGDSLYVLDSFLTPVPGFPLYLPHPTRGLFVYDMDSDSEMEIFLCGHRNYVVKINGTVPLTDSNAYYPNSFCLPLDFNGNGKVDVAFYHTSYPDVGVWEVQDTGLVPLMVKSQGISTRRKFGISADVDGDGKDEFIISDSRSILHAYSYGWDLDELPGFPINLSDMNAFRSSQVVSPSAFEYSGKLYMYGPTEANVLYVWMSAGRSRWGGRFANRWATNSPASLPDSVAVKVSEIPQEIRHLSYTLKGREITVSGDGEIDVKLYSVSGRLLKRLKGEGEVRAKLDFPTGIYLIKAEDESKVKVFKIILR